MIGLLAAGAAGIMGMYAVNYINQDMHRPFIDYVEENYPYPVSVAEIGVFWGSNAKRMLSILDVSMMYLIDPYLKYEEYNAEMGIYPFLPTDFTMVMQFLSDYEDRIVPLQMTSEEAAPSVPDGLDVVYIDGNHSYDYVKMDIELYYPKVRSGGIIGGHDIDGNPISHEVAKAVYEFADAHNLEVFIDPPDWWYIKP